jgi:type II secretory pathway pseudopilin PulG
MAEPVTDPDSSPQTSAESGFGLIEVVISMLLIGLLAIAFLPLLITTMQATVLNSTVASATQVVTQQLEQARASGSSCSAVKAFAAAEPAPVDQPRGPLQPHLSLDLPASDVCQEPYLRTVALRVWVTEEGSTSPLAEATTLILLDAP